MASRKQQVQILTEKGFKDLLHLLAPFNIDINSENLLGTRTINTRRQNSFPCTAGGLL